MTQLTIRTPDDWHCHFRDNEALALTVPHAAESFERVIAMPNLTTPITTLEQAQTYQQRILAACPSDRSITPLMTLYLTPNLTPDLLSSGHTSGLIHAVKLYPHNVTTHSEAGVRDWAAIEPILAHMQDIDLPLLIHGESPGDLDVFEREPDFITRTLQHITQHFPTLRVVFEHISTQEAVNFVQAASHYVGATITPHHLCLNRNDLLDRHLRPHHYCLPVLKHRNDQTALIEAATSGDPHFFLGTDSAPHSRTQKESHCGCAGIYNTPVALAAIADVFESQNALHQLEPFTSLHGAAFYKQPVNTSTLTLHKQPWTVPDAYPMGTDTVVPLFAGQTLTWQIKIHTT